MSNKIVKYQDNIIKKIKRFINNIFNKIELKNNNYKDITPKQKVEFQIQDDFLEQIKVDPNETDKIIFKKSFLEEIDGNFEALSMLSTDRLVKLEKYYDSAIKENEKKIKKLKANG